MTDTSHEMLASIQECHNDMIDTLHEHCEINSGSENLNGLKSMRETLHEYWSPLSDEINTIPGGQFEFVTMTGEVTQQTSGDILFIRKRPELKRRILFSGHMDTVFSVDHPFQSLRYLDDNTINGPGVADMKGGLIVMKHALQAFEQFHESNNIGWDVLINADEEIGSMSSAALYREIVPNYQAALVYEPAMTPSGVIAKNRRGSGKLTLIAKGKSAHAGRSFYEGRNAICYLAEVITKIHALNGLREGVTINIGLIQGGSALNAVPDTAVTKLDVRINDPLDEVWVRKELDIIFETQRHSDYQLVLHGSFARPVKRVSAATERLFERIRQAGKILGLSIDWQDSGGCCDGNNIAQMGIPVIDTLGVRGGNIHSDKEYILLDSMIERARLSALLLNDLASGGLEDLKL